MSKRSVSLRLEASTVAAFDAADGNRSKVMRSVLRSAVEDGEVDGVPDDLRTLAAVEGVKDRGRLARSRATFRRRLAEYFRDKWESGYVTGEDAAELAESWRDEAAVYGEDYLAFVEAVVAWYRERWGPVARPEWPDPSEFYRTVDPESIDVAPRLAGVMRDARDDGLDREVAVRRVAKFHEGAAVREAARMAWGDGGEPDAQ